MRLRKLLRRAQTTTLVVYTIAMLLSIQYEADGQAKKLHVFVDNSISWINQFKPNELLQLAPEKTDSSSLYVVSYRSVFHCVWRHNYNLNYVSMCLVLLYKPLKYCYQYVKILQVNFTCYCYCFSRVLFWGVVQAYTALAECCSEEWYKPILL